MEVSKHLLSKIEPAVQVPSEQFQGNSVESGEVSAATAPSGRQLLSSRSRSAVYLWGQTNEGVRKPLNDRGVNESDLLGEDTPQFRGQLVRSSSQTRFNRASVKGVFDTERVPAMHPMAGERRVVVLPAVQVVKTSELYGRGHSGKAFGEQLFYHLCFLALKSIDVAVPQERIADKLHLAKQLLTEMSVEDVLRLDAQIGGRKFDSILTNFKEYSGNNDAYIFFNVIIQHIGKKDTEDFKTWRYRLLLSKILAPFGKSAKHIEGLLTGQIKVADLCKKSRLASLSPSKTTTELERLIDRLTTIDTCTALHEDSEYRVGLIIALVKLINLLVNCKDPVPKKLITSKFVNAMKTDPHFCSLIVKSFIKEDLRKLGNDEALNLLGVAALNLLLFSENLQKINVRRVGYNEATDKYFVIEQETIKWEAASIVGGTSQMQRDTLLFFVAAILIHLEKPQHSEAWRAPKLVEFFKSRGEFFSVRGRDVLYAKTKEFYERALQKRREFHALVNDKKL